MFNDQRCSHNVPYALRCNQCLQEGLARATPERRNSCHVTYQITGHSCAMPNGQTDHGCNGCWHFEGGPNAVQA